MSAQKNAAKKSPAKKPVKASAPKAKPQPKAPAGKKAAPSGTKKPAAAATKAKAKPAVSKAPAKPASGKASAPKGKPVTAKAKPTAAASKPTAVSKAKPAAKPAPAKSKHAAPKAKPAQKAPAKPAAKKPVKPVAKAKKPAAPSKAQPAATAKQVQGKKEAVKSTTVTQTSAPAKVATQQKKPEATAKPVKTEATAPAKSAAGAVPAPIRARTLKIAKHTSVKPSSSSKQDNSATTPEMDAKTKELVLNARKRTANTSAPRALRSRGGAPIVFTMDDVAQALAKKQAETTPKASSSAAEAPAAKVAAKKQEIDLEAQIPQEKRVHSAVSLSDILGFNPAAKKPANVGDNGQEIPRKWARYHKALIELRQQVSSVLEQHTADTLKRSNRDDSGDLSGYGQHMADAGTDTFDRDFALSMVSSEQEALFEISEAIRRIQNGTYGVCEITGEPIAAERLEAVPFTRYSLEGQKELEKTKRNKIQRGGVFSDNEDNISFEEDDN